MSFFNRCGGWTVPGHVTCTCLVAELARGSTLYSWSSYTMLLQGSVFIIVSQRVNFVLMVFLNDVAPGISFLYNYLWEDQLCSHGLLTWCCSRDQFFKIIISERVNFFLMVFLHDVAPGDQFFIIVSEGVNFVLMVFVHDVAPGISFFIIVS